MQRLAYGATLVLCDLTPLLLPPALPDAHAHSETPLDSTGRVPQRGQDFGASALLVNGALCPVRRPHILAMTRGHFQMIATGLGLLLPPPPRRRDGGLRGRQEGLRAAVACRTRRRIAPVGPQRVAGGPGLRGHFCMPRLPRVQPAPPP
jgi:hypothetical protein